MLSLSAALTSTPVLAALSTAPLPPALLAPPPLLSVVVDEPVAFDLGAVFGGAVRVRLAEGATLPEGLRLEGLTLTGAPPTPTDGAVAVTLVAGNLGGETLATLRLEVRPPAPPLLVAPPGALTVFVGAPILVDLDAAFEGAERIRLADGAALPDGLRLEGMTLTGAATAPTGGAIEVPLLASNAGGETMTTLRVEVRASQAAELWSPQRLEDFFWWRADAATTDGAGAVRQIATARDGVVANWRPPVAGDPFVAGGPVAYDAAQDMVVTTGDAKPLVAELPRPVGGVEGLTYLFVGVPPTRSRAVMLNTYDPAVTIANFAQHKLATTYSFGDFQNPVGAALATGELMIVIATVIDADRDGEPVYGIWKNGAPLVTGESGRGGFASRAQRHLLMGDASNNANNERGPMAWRAVGVGHGVLDAEAREALEGWAYHTLLTERERADIALPGAHPWRAGPPEFGGPPTVVAVPAPLSLSRDLRMEPLEIGARVSGATAFSAVGLPAGLAIDPITGAVSGAPQAAEVGVATITALNEDGAATVELPFAVSEPPAAARSAADVFAMAFAADPDARIALDMDVLAPGLDTLHRLGAMRGEVEARVVGVADFVASELPQGVGYAGGVALPFTDASGAPGATDPAPGHFLLGARDDAAMGPERGLPPPLDHIDGRPLGLKINRPSSASDFQTAWRNGVRFSAPYDGHIVWVAEYLAEDGRTLFTAWNEDITRAANPPLRHAASTVTPGSAAIWLRRMVALEVASMDALRPAEATGVRGYDPRLWRPAPKLWRDEITPDAAVSPGVDPGAAFANLQAAIAALPVADGRVAGHPDRPYVLQLPQGEMWRGSGASANTTLLIEGAALAKLEALEQGALLLVGHPDGSFLPTLALGGDARLDVAWVTFQPQDVVGPNGGELPTPGSRRLISLADRARLRLFGCVLDGVDGQPSSAIIIRGDAVVEVYDSLIEGTATALDLSTVPDNRADTGARALMARTVTSVQNDGVNFYYQGAMLLESNYVMGAGGRYDETSQNTAHRDSFAQIQLSGSGVHTQRFNFAAYHNIIAAGPNFTPPVSDRGLNQVLQYEPRQADVFELAYNIMENVNDGRGVGRIWPVSRPPLGQEDAAPRWLNRATMAYNITWDRPDLLSSGSHPPTFFAGVYIGGDAGAAVQDNALAWGNVSRIDANRSIQSNFGRSVNLLPEEIDDAQGRAAYPDATEAFAAPPAVSGSWRQGYALDWSQTTYGGGSREGYLAAADFAALPALARYGAQGGPGLPTLDEQAGRFIDLPADMRVHLGDTERAFDGTRVGRADSPVAADWFERWAPRPFAPNRVLTNPWAGREADPYKLVINTRIETRAAGTIAEEIAQNGAGWRLELLADSFRPRWTLFGPTDEGNPLLARITDRRGVRDGDRLLFGVNTLFRPLQIEGGEAPPKGRQMVRDWGDFRVRIHSGPTPPPAPPAPTVSDRTVWFDATDGNEAKEWDGQGWRLLQGPLADFLPSWMGPHAQRVNGRDRASRYNADNRLADGAFTFHFGHDRARYSGTPQTGDFGFFVHADAENPRPKGDSHSTVHFEADGVWRPAAADRAYHTEFGVGDRYRGWVDAYFRVNGAYPELTTDWIWTGKLGATAAENVSAAIPTGVLRIGAATASPASGLRLNYFEARRQRVTSAANNPASLRIAQADHMGLPVYSSSIEHLFGRRPLDLATGDRGAYLGPAAVWELAP